MVKAAKVHFPLPKSYFEREPLTLEQNAHHIAIRDARLAAALAAEHDFVHEHRRLVDLAQWKLLSKKKDLCVYRRRAKSSNNSELDINEQVNQPTMLGVGTLDGTLEDLVYGAYDKSTAEMKTTMSYVDVYNKDCCVLHNVEVGNRDDPFRYLGIKWMAFQLPGKMFVRPRDWCFIDAMGIEKDGDGRRYGYNIYQSVDVSGCPPFDQRAVVRGQGALSFIYRETGPGVVEIFAQGLFDPKGELIQYASIIMTTELLTGMAMTIRCAEAKKLTIMAIRNYRNGVREERRSSCYLCVKSDRKLFSSLKQCKICGRTTCDKCRIKRLIFLGPNHSVCEVLCCHTCILEAKTMEVRPAEESFSMHGRDMRRVPEELIVRNPRNMNDRTMSVSSGSGPGSVNSFDDGSTDSTIADNRKYSSLGEADLEKIIASMVDQRINEQLSRSGSQRLEFHPHEDETSKLASAPTPSASGTARPTDQAEIFQKMVALQQAASQVYAITQANEEMMRKFKSRPKCVSTTKHPPSVPLPKDYFNPPPLSNNEKDRYREIIRARLARALRDEHEFVRIDRRLVSVAKWRLVKKKRQLHIYRRRANSLTSDEVFNRKPSMLGVGAIQGTLEDVIYGIYDKSHDEMKTTISYVDVSAKDCTVLHNIDLATASDPFQYTGIKWALQQYLTSVIVRPRDWCYLESMGIRQDARGDRFGYFILHSVNLSHCPPFDRHFAVRGRMRLSFIFREPVRGVVEIFAQGLYDPAGELIQHFTTIATAEVLSGIYSSVQCAESKKLTLLALWNFRGNLEYDIQKTCHVCRGSGSMFTSLKQCRVCGATVCSQCRSNKLIFAGPAHSLIKVSCCQKCVTYAATMEVRPAEPSFSILGDQHLPQDEFLKERDTESSRGEDVAVWRSRLPLPPLMEEDETESRTDELSEITDKDDHLHRVSTDNGMSEEDVEKILESMRSEQQEEKLSTPPVALKRQPTVDDALEFTDEDIPSLDHAAILKCMLELQAIEAANAKEEAAATRQIRNTKSK
uniref:FYVE-type domain-containing protein n=1 Tax=Globisporangium ultimum (strain ATCC 200006 / CBS 805.95 / DAOM BR144) TaxID=431595 RepID=K3WXE1_GLOUD